MGRHVFTKDFDGQRGRFIKILSDDEFVRLLQEIKNELPKGWKVTHLEDDEDVKNSKRVQVLAKYPLVRTSFGKFADVAESIKADARL